MQKFEKYNYQLLKIKNFSSCWAFGAIGALESFNARKSDTSVTQLSEQQLVDCDTSWNAGCDGGDHLAGICMIMIISYIRFSFHETILFIIA